MREGETWRFNDFAGIVGDSDLAGDLAIEPGEERSLLTADLVSERLDFDDLAGFIGARPEIDDSNDAPDDGGGSDRLLPDTAVDLERLRAMDMDVHFVGSEVLAPGYALEKMEASLNLRDGLAVVEPMYFGIAGGSIDGRLRLSRPD